MVGAPFSMMRLPVTVEPVNEIRSTRGLMTSSSPTRWSDDVTTLTTPAGMSVCSATRRPRRVAFHGVSGAGLRIIVLPVASAWPSLWSVDLEREVPRDDGADHAGGLLAPPCASAPPNALPSGSSRSHSNVVDDLGRPEQAVLQRRVELRAVGERDRAADLGDQLGAELLLLAHDRRLQLARGTAGGTRGWSTSRSRRTPGARRRWRAPCRRRRRRRPAPSTSSVAGLTLSKRLPDAASTSSPSMSMRTSPCTVPGRSVSVVAMVVLRS